MAIPRTLSIPHNPDDLMGIKYKALTFFGGEEHIVIEDPEVRFHDQVFIYFKFTGSVSLLQLVLATDALRRMGPQKITLLCPYFPAARADRVDQEENPGEALGVKVYARIINAQKYERVLVFDPHSFVAPAVIKNCVTINNHQFVSAVCSSLKLQNMAVDKVIAEPAQPDPEPLQFVLISPDAGANKKAYSLANALTRSLNEQIPVIRADKSRDVTTGKLLHGSCTVFADDLKGKTCLIVDDICSRGGTFKPLATKLRELGAKDVYLIVSHDEGVADHAALKEAGITKMFTTNSRTSTPTSDFFEVHDVMPYLTCPK